MEICRAFDLFEFTLMFITSTLGTGYIVWFTYRTIKYRKRIKQGIS